MLSPSRAPRGSLADCCKAAVGRLAACQVTAKEKRLWVKVQQEEVLSSILLVFLFSYRARGVGVFWRVLATVRTARLHIYKVHMLAWH